MTLEDLSSRSDLTPNYIGNVEHGQRDPSLTTMKALADGLDMPLAEFFGPPPALSPEALEVAHLFDDSPEDLKASLLQTLHALVKPLKR
jgi:transcriptional regulator with XRE-family HTH domain